MKPIKGYEDHYAISEDGAVTNVKTGRVLKNHLSKNDGYLRVVLCRDSTRKNIKVHRLVAIAFIPNPENKRTVNHLDSDRANNHISNLEWATHSENTQHAFAHGFMSQASLRNFTDTELELMLKAYLTGASISDMVRDAGAGKNTLLINLRRVAKALNIEDKFNAEHLRQVGTRPARAVAGRRKSIRQFTADGLFIQDHLSMRDAARSLGKTSNGSIQSALDPNRGQQLAHGYRWEFI